MIASAQALGRFVPISCRFEKRKNPTVTEKVLAAVIFLVGCAYETDFADCTVRCSAEIGCPADLTCDAEKFCRSPIATSTCVLENGPMSCIVLAETCGPNNNEDCCSTGTQIPGGNFFRSFDVASDAMYASMNNPATVSPFALDRFEVTVGRFRQFVEGGARATHANPPNDNASARPLNGLSAQGGWDPGWNANLVADTNTLLAALKCDAAQSWTDSPGANEDLPINCVTWFEAFAFCAWDGGFLPTETEWNFAAVGGDEQRAYPWSSPPSSTTIDCSFANYNNAGYCTEPPNGAVSHVGSSSKGDSKYRQADLAGNVFEWVLDGFSPLGETCNDCANLSSTSSRVLRGGGWDNQSTDVRTNFRFDRPPTFRHRAVGIRCARYL